MLDQLFPGRASARAAQSRLRAAEDGLRVSDAMFRIAQPAMVTDARRRILRVNDAFCELMGYAAEEMIGNTPWMFRSNHHDPAFYATMLESILGTGRWEGEVWDRRKDGAVFPKWMTISSVTDAAGGITHFVATYLDRSERKQAQDRIQQLQFYDALTRLPNRALLGERLQHALVESARSGSGGALLLIDWDHLKRLNDSLGHARGDALLQQIGQRLVQGLRASDTVARLGGDEFAVLLPALGPDLPRVAARAEVLAAELHAALAAAYQLADSEYQGTASVGLVLFQGDGANADALLEQAEKAMYQAKAQGRNRLHFFDAELERSVAERVQLERELRRGIGQGELVLHYQPQIALRDGEPVVVGAEALVRWNHPAHGLLAPGRFIPMAEESGLIKALGHWVLQAACTELGSWRRDAGKSGLTLAVNVSAAQFLDEGFVAQVQAALAGGGAEPPQLKLELTESLLVSNTEAVIETMQALERLGVRLSLDDFGTGYSSLAYLKRLPLHQLKIDQSFVRDLQQGRSDAAIARSIVALADSLGLSVIAEGVETEAQRVLLAGMGCRLYQGYLFSRPLPRAQFHAYVERQALAAVA